MCVENRIGKTCVGAEVILRINIGKKGVDGGIGRLTHLIDSPSVFLVSLSQFITNCFKLVLSLFQFFSRGGQPVLN